MDFGFMQSSRTERCVRAGATSMSLKRVPQTAIASTQLFRAIHQCFQAKCVQYVQGTITYSKLFRIKTETEHVLIAARGAFRVYPAEARPDQERLGGRPF